MDGRDIGCMLEGWIEVQLQEGILPGMVKERYSSYSRGVGKKIRDGKVCEMLSTHALFTQC